MTFCRIAVVPASTPSLSKMKSAPEADIRRVQDVQRLVVEVVLDRPVSDPVRVEDVLTGYEVGDGVDSIRSEITKSEKVALAGAA